MHHPYRLLGQEELTTLFLHHPRIVVLSDFEKGTLVDAISRLPFSLRGISREQFTAYFPVLFYYSLVNAPLIPTHQLGGESSLLFCVIHQGLIESDALEFNCGHLCCRRCDAFSPHLIACCPQCKINIHSRTPFSQVQRYRDRLKVYCRSRYHLRSSSQGLDEDFPSQFHSKSSSTFLTEPSTSISSKEKIEIKDPRLTQIHHINPHHLRSPCVLSVENECGTDEPRRGFVVSFQKPSMIDLGFASPLHPLIQSHTQIWEERSSDSLSNTGCLEHVPLAQMAQHDVKCAHRMVACPHGCLPAVLLPAYLMPKHIANCSSFFGPIYLRNKEPILPPLSPLVSQLPASPSVLPSLTHQPASRRKVLQPVPVMSVATPNPNVKMCVVCKLEIWGDAAQYQTHFISCSSAKVELLLATASMGKDLRPAYDHSGKRREIGTLQVLTLFEKPKK